MSAECTCDTMLKNGIIFICFRDPLCPEHGDEDAIHTEEMESLKREEKR